MRIKLVISYDGAPYMGFQIQGDEKTIELELVKALKNVTLEDIKIYASGRTDKGVHALGQVIHFDTSKNISLYGWKRALNSFLPDDIRVMDVEYVSDDFHARFSAKSKEYHYFIETGEYDLFKRNYRAFYKNLDISLMQDGLKKLCGKHNFKGFCSGSVDPRKDFCKTIYEAYIIKNGTELEFVFKGNGFLKYQIRRMMGLIIEIGRKRDTLETIDRVFLECDPKISHMCAPSSGLYLVKVNY